MKTIEWKIVLSDDNKIISAENAIGFPKDSIESHLTIIGLLENIKQKHLDKMKIIFEKTVRKGDNEEQNN